MTANKSKNKSDVLNKSILIIILSSTLSLFTTANAYGHTQPYLNGYRAGLNNVTINTACGQYTGTAYDNCDSGFNNAGAAVQKTTPEYQHGFQVAKNDSITTVYDATDACAKYKGEANTNCDNGYSAGYDNKLMFTVDSITQQYKHSAEYIAGFNSGVVNGNKCMFLLSQ
ncbi:MAG: hypothetical protein WA667_07290 [Candidatus Nitrosopolaris sp.]